MPRLLNCICVVAIGVSIFSIVFLPFTQVVIWDGAFALTVRLDNRATKEIKRIAYVDERRERGRDKPEQFEWNCLKESFQFFDGSTFVARITCGGKRDGWDRELSYGEFNLMLLEVEFEDGTVVRKLVDVPPGRRAREVTVVIP